MNFKKSKAKLISLQGWTKLCYEF